MKILDVFTQRYENFMLHRLKKILISKFMLYKIKCKKNICKGIKGHSAAVMDQQFYSA